MKVKLTSIRKSNKEEKGKYGTFRRLFIKCDEYQDKTLCGFSTTCTDKWQIDDIVDIEIKQNGQYLNFKPVKSENNNLDLIKIVEISEENNKILKLIYKKITMLENVK